jgi:hypothetical protein
MANDKRFVVKNGLQSQNINFVSPGNLKNITATMLDSDTLSFSGNSGQLFSITDSLSGTIFAVNDISGIPSIEVDDDGTVRFAETFGNVLIGTASDNGNKLQINGTVSANNITIAGALSANGSIGTSGQTLRSDGSKAFWSTEVGYTGSRGATGFTGSLGFTGSVGNVGFTGSQGATGFTGSQGIIGFTGSAGFNGSVGFTGSQGVIGFTGSQGSSNLGSAVGGGTDRIFFENDKTITTNYEITANRNAMTAGPVTINSGITITIPTGSRWVIV